MASARPQKSCPGRRSNCFVESHGPKEDERFRAQRGIEGYSPP